mgnify:CR=1 FL=1
MSKTRVKKSDARQRIVETAERLFYAEGVRAVGIDRIIAEARKILRGEGKQGRRPHLWDGKAAERIVEILARELA